MARRFRRFIRRRGRLPSSLSPKWVSTSFDSNIDDTAAANTSLVLCDPATIISAAQLEVNQTVAFKRVIISGGINFQVEQGAFTEIESCFRFALYANDVEDTDTAIDLTSPGSIMNTERVMHWSCVPFTLYEVATATIGNQGLGLSLPVNVDFKGNGKLRADQQLLFTIQLHSNVSSVTTSITAHFVARVLVTPP